MMADLLLCSQSCVLRMARKCPEVVTMDPHEVTQRLMLLKVCTSDSTVSLTKQADSGMYQPCWSGNRDDGKTCKCNTAVKKCRTVLLCYASLKYLL